MTHSKSESSSLQEHLLLRTIWSSWITASQSLTWVLASWADCQCCFTVRAYFSRTVLHSMEFFWLLFWIINGENNSWLLIKNFFRRWRTHPRLAVSHSSTSSSCFQTELEVWCYSALLPYCTAPCRPNNGQLILFLMCSFIVLHTSSSTRHKLIASLLFHTQIVSDPYDIKMADPYAGENVADYDM